MIETKNIEVRPLSCEELYELLLFSPESETRNLIRTVESAGTDPHMFFRNNAIEEYGILIEHTPVYVAYIIPHKEKYELWTVVCGDMKDYYSLFRISKRVLDIWVKRYKVLHSTMERENIKNIEWTKRLGFKTVNEDDRTITLKLEA